MQLRRKPRTPFPYILLADRGRPEPEQARFIIVPPTARTWADLMDAGAGTNGALVQAVVQCVERLENHPDADAFGKPGSVERGTFVDEMDITVIRELGNAVAETLLSETERKN